ncbi:MAG TPA: hypothetical protein PLG80_01840 [Syntrophales bacterium]|nr:hypothetical protein [Syntrophales bacterium]
MQGEKKSFAEKHPSSAVVDEALKQRLDEEAREGLFPCRRAEKLAADLGIPLGEIGKALDLLGIKIVHCQLGLFGYPPHGRIVQPAPAVAPELANAIEKALISGHLPCEKAWLIAEDFKMPRIDVASACECLKVKIKPCQLGAF